MRRIPVLVLALLLLAGGTAALAAGGTTLAPMAIDGLEGRGTAQEPYQIYDENDLDIMFTSGNADNDFHQGVYFSLEADIVLVGRVWDHTFSGTINGNGRKIDGADNSGGLFAKLENATVTGITLTNAVISGTEDTGLLADVAINTRFENCNIAGDIWGTDNVGVLVGYAEGCTITGCTVSGMVYDHDSDNPGENLGGVAGAVQGGTIQTCNTRVDFTTNGTNVGGIVGSAIAATLDGNEAVQNIETDGDNVGGIAGVISGTTSITRCDNDLAVAGVDNVGGIVGLVSGGTVTGVHNTGNISGNNAVGGVAGSITNGSVSACYSTGSVTSSGSISAAGTAGGIAGYMQNSAQVSRCYATGTITSDSYGGGIVGRAEGAGTARPTISDCYADTRVVKGSTTSPNEYARLGGIAGNLISANVTYCYALGEIVSSTVYRGGIAGRPRAPQSRAVWPCTTSWTMSTTPASSTTPVATPSAPATPGRTGLPAPRGTRARTSPPPR